MAAQVPAQQKIQNIRGLLERSRGQMAMALPKHLTAERLIRVAMTSIQKTPKLMDCTPQSLLGCIMTCASLGLEPDQFLGQAYLVPFRDSKTNTTICTLIPGYRGYIALARRSGEVQSVSAQVVYSNDRFDLVYGIEDKLEHRPCMDGDRGNPIGAYCVFKYKDGGYSFDFMSFDDIERIHKRSKSASDGPWVTDWAEMAKKTIIKRHAKLAPLSVEFQRAVALEERANEGTPQSDLLDMPEVEQGIIDVEKSDETLLQEFEASIPKGAGAEDIAVYLDAVAKANKISVNDLKIGSARDKKDLEKLWKTFPAWVKKTKKNEEANSDNPEMAPAKCPNNPEITYLKKHCDEYCDVRQGCPVW